MFCDIFPISKAICYPIVNVVYSPCIPAPRSLLSTVYLPCIYRICTVFNSAKDTKKAALFWAAFWNICVCKTGLHTINDYSTI